MWCITYTSDRSRLQNITGNETSYAFAGFAQFRFLHVDKVIINFYGHRFSFLQDSVGDEKLEEKPYLLNIARPHTGTVKPPCRGSVKGAYDSMKHTKCVHYWWIIKGRKYCPSCKITYLTYLSYKNLKQDKLKTVQAIIFNTNTITFDG